MYSISISKTSLGSRYSGIPTLIIPPGSDSASKTVTGNPILANSQATVSPAGPEPIMAIFPLRVLGKSSCKLQGREFLL